MEVFGLTGGIASGKSTVSSILKNEFNISVIDADTLARKAVEPNRSGLSQIVAFFGKDILLSDGSLNRKKLGKVTFNDAKKIKILNNIIHPLVDEMFLEKVKEYEEKRHPWIIYDCPLLMEEKLMHRVHKTILVTVDEPTQLARLMERESLDKQQALNRVRLQMSMKEKLKRADYIIYNDGDYLQLREGVHYLWKIISRGFVSS
ncbi:MAG: dephospho-CoA kinase [Eubacteriales bacterium]